jgi:hypothetical protein
MARPTRPTQEDSSATGAGLAVSTSAFWITV